MENCVLDAGPVMSTHPGHGTVQPYMIFPRPEWAALRANVPQSLGEADIASLRGHNEPVSLEDITEIYLPLSRLLNLHVMATRSLNNMVKSAFIGAPMARMRL